MTIKKKKINNRKKQVVSKFFNAKKNKKVFLSKLSRFDGKALNHRAKKNAASGNSAERITGCSQQYIGAAARHHTKIFGVVARRSRRGGRLECAQEKAVFKKKKNLKLTRKIELHPVGGLGKVSLQKGGRASIKYKVLSKKRTEEKKLEIKKLGKAGKGEKMKREEKWDMNKFQKTKKNAGENMNNICLRRQAERGDKEKSKKVSSIEVKGADLKINTHLSTLPALAQWNGAGKVGGEKVVKKEWVILDFNNGEEFALKECIAASEKNNYKNNIDRSIMGIPEANRNTQWNLIEVKESIKNNYEDEKYILDDYDVLQETENFSKNLSYPIRSYNSSPYVVDLKKKDEQVETEGLKEKSAKFKESICNICKFASSESLRLRFWRKSYSFPIASSESRLGDSDVTVVQPEIFCRRYWRKFYGLFNATPKSTLNRCLSEDAGAGLRMQANSDVVKSAIPSLSAVCALPAQAGGSHSCQPPRQNFGAGGKGWEISGKIASPYLYYKILNFAVIALLIVSPIYGFKQYIKIRAVQGRVLGASVSAIDNLKLGKDLMQANNFYEAKEIFNKAGDDFKSAYGALEEINNLSYKIAFLIFNKEEEVKSAAALISAGKKASEVSVILADSFKNISSSFDELAFENAEIGAHSLSETASGDGEQPQLALNSAASENSSAAETADCLRGQGCIKRGGENKFFDRDFSSLISDFHNTLEMTFPKIREIKEYLKTVNEEAVPENDRENFNQVKNLLLFVDSKLNFYEDAVYVLDKFFAKNSFKRYLLIFQNNNEIRPAGGFIGSYSLIDIKDGKITNIETPAEGSYYLEGSLLENIKPPRALRLVNGRWEFQDANWWPDFPRSAKFISDIYEKSGGRTADGVIAINASLMQDILKITGPIAMNDYNKIIDSENFIEETQKAVELEYDKKENKPKKIIADLMPRVMENMFSADKEKFLDILSALNAALRKRDMQLYFKDDDLESRTVKSGWAGEIKNIKNRDYLSVIDTNLGGRKTDGVIEQKIEHNTNVLDDGTIIDELIIHKKHNGIKGDYFEGVNNVDYLRVYVPIGSVLLSAEGFNAPTDSCFKELEANIIEDEFLSNIESREKTDIESGTIIGESFGKTYFANWTQVDPGEEVSIRLSYKLPFKVFDSDSAAKYSLYIQKQSGSREHTLKKSLYYPDSLQTAWSYPGAPENGEWVKYDKLDTDKFYGAIFTK